MVVRTKEDFERIKTTQPKEIVFEGEMAEKIKKAITVKKIGKGVAIGGGLLTTAGVIAGLVSAPFTGGALLILSVMTLFSATTAAAVATVAGTTIVLTTSQLAIIAGVVALAFLRCSFCFWHRLGILRNREYLERCANGFVLPNKSVELNFKMNKFEDTKRFYLG